MDLLFGGGGQGTAGVGHEASGGHSFRGEGGRMPILPEGGHLELILRVSRILVLLRVG